MTAPNAFRYRHDATARLGSSVHGYFSPYGPGFSHGRSTPNTGSSSPNVDFPVTGFSFAPGIGRGLTRFGAEQSDPDPRAALRPACRGVAPRPPVQAPCPRLIPMTFGITSGQSDLVKGVNIKGPWCYHHEPRRFFGTEYDVRGFAIGPRPG